VVVKVVTTVVVFAVRVLFRIRDDLGNVVVVLRSRTSFTLLCDLIVILFFLLSASSSVLIV
jgi:hypothetical protein